MLTTEQETVDCAGCAKRMPVGRAVLVPTQEPGMWVAYCPACWKWGGVNTHPKGV